MLLTKRLTVGFLFDSTANIGLYYLTGQVSFIGVYFFDGLVSMTAVNRTIWEVVGIINGRRRHGGRQDKPVVGIY